MHCFDKGFLIKFGQLYFKQSSATRSKCSLICVRAVDQKRILFTCSSWTKTGMPLDQKGYYSCWFWTKTDMPVDLKGYFTCWSWTTSLVHWAYKAQYYRTASHFLSKTMYCNREAEYFSNFPISSCNYTIVSVLYWSIPTLSLTRKTVTCHLHFLSQYWKFVQVQRSIFRCISVNVLTYQAKALEQLTLSYLIYCGFLVSRKSCCSLCTHDETNCPSNMFWRNGPILRLK